ncbi:phosphodiester glycosidase family protein [Anaerolineales bacterium HSG25]|nr:phosphodiester glycosidase family protein [Anaerolineales bacterium HSG25]
MKYILRILSFFAILTIILLTYIGWRYASRPSLSNYQATLFQGIEYERRLIYEPRQLLMHIIKIDLTEPTLRFFVTPGITPGDKRFKARTTTEFVDEFNLQLAINASYFGPFYSNHPLDYYPHSGDPTNVRGLVISDGITYSHKTLDLPIFCVLPDNQIQIQQRTCPLSVEQAIVGASSLIEHGQPIPIPDKAHYHDLKPRVAVGLDKTGQTLWILVIDGRQPYYSDGVTIPEMTELLLSLGAYQAIKFDGGGSATLAVADETGTRLLNAPIHARVPMWERPVATHLGIYAEK